jgi:hypothetical protein
MKIQAIVLGVAVASSVASAVEIFAVNNLPGGAAPDRLVRFDSANPAGWSAIGPITTVGNLGFSGLDFAGVGGGLYAWAGFGTGFANNGGLYRVNPATGAGARITSGAAQANIQDLSWNPVLNRMFAVESSAAGGTNLREVNLVTGTTTVVGAITGLPTGALNVGLAHDSQGRIFLHDLVSDQIYRGVGLAVSSLYTIGRNTNFSQGMTIDWSGNDTGYHASIGNVPAFFSELFSFDANGAGYNLVGNFGTPSGTTPTFEGGDLAINPIPAPGAVGVLAIAGAFAARRRRA